VVSKESVGKTEEQWKRGKEEKPDRERYKEKVVPPPRVELGTC
jgi:hypothetical protein